MKTNRLAAKVTGIMGGALGASMLVTLLLLLSQGRWREAIPLHLCSLSGIAALLAALGMRGGTVDFLWYLGLPGALLALLFPAPALSAHQLLMNASYTITHGLIVLMPAAMMACGAYPRAGRAGRMMLCLQGAAMLAFAANRLLGTDFLFLRAPAPGTPLEALFALGYPAYLLLLEGAALCVCLVQGALAARLARGFDRGGRGRFPAVQKGKNAL